MLQNIYCVSKLLQVLCTKILSSNRNARIQVTIKILHPVSWCEHIYVWHSLTSFMLWNMVRGREVIEKP